MNFIFDNAFAFIIAFLILLLPWIIKNKFSASQIGSLSLTIGITGTFFGIFIGLLEFDTSNIEKSVPLLLDGLKIAFLTSLCGLATNILVKLFPSFYGINEELESDDVGEEMIKTLKSIDIKANEMNSNLNNLSNSISSDKDTSLVTQLQKIRTTNSDGFQSMKDAFEEFAEKVVADNTQSLIDALTDVMKDFNVKINEQFGENFKELNEAVKSMVEWQKNYKDQVNQLINQYNKISENLTGIDEALENSADSYKTIIESNNQLNNLVEDFSGMVNSFSDLGKKASESLPIIEKNMNSIIDKSKIYIEDSLQNLSKDYDNFSKKQQEIVDSYNDTTEKMIQDNAERVKRLDEELGNELTKSLESLANSLGTLSAKFVEDYTPLTEKLRELLKSTNT